MSSTKSCTTGCNKDSKAQCCAAENKGDNCCSGQKCCEKKYDCNCTKGGNCCSGQKCCEKKCDCNCTKGGKCCTGKKCCEEKCSCNCAANKSCCCSDKKCCNDESTCNCAKKETCCCDKKCCESSTPEPETNEAEEYPNACKCQGCICLCSLPENRRK